MKVSGLYRTVALLTLANASATIPETKHDLIARSPRPVGGGRETVEPHIAGQMQHPPSPPTRDRMPIDPAQRPADVAETIPLYRRTPTSLDILPSPGETRPYRHELGDTLTFYLGDMWDAMVDQAKANAARIGGPLSSEESDFIEKSAEAKRMEQTIFAEVYEYWGLTKEDVQKRLIFAIEHPPSRRPGGATDGEANVDERVTSWFAMDGANVMMCEVVGNIQPGIAAQTYIRIAGKYLGPPRRDPSPPTQQMGSPIVFKDNRGQDVRAISQTGSEGIYAAGLSSPSNERDPAVVVEAAQPNVQQPSKRWAAFRAGYSEGGVMGAMRTLKHKGPVRRSHKQRRNVDMAVITNVADPGNHNASLTADWSLRFAAFNTARSQASATILPYLRAMIRDRETIPSYRTSALQIHSELIWADYVVASPFFFQGRNRIDAVQKAYLNGSTVATTEAQKTLIAVTTDLRDRYEDCYRQCGEALEKAGLWDTLVKLAGQLQAQDPDIIPHNVLGESGVPYTDQFINQLLG